MQKLSSFGQGKKIWPKKSLTRLLHEAPQFENTSDSVHAWAGIIDFGDFYL